jgi:hypothetical protein
VPGSVFFSTASVYGGSFHVHLQTPLPRHLHFGKSVNEFQS